MRLRKLDIVFRRRFVTPRRPPYGRLTLRSGCSADASTARLKPNDRPTLWPVITRALALLLIS